MARITTRPKDTRSAILDAALAVAAEEGVKGVTHRKVAIRANVSLGSTNYHFSSMDALMLAAFQRFAEQESRKYAPLLDAATNIKEIIDASLTLVQAQHSDVTGAVLLYELYAEGVRDQHYRAIVQAWSRQTTARIERLCGFEAAVAFEVIWEGLTFQRLLGNSSLSDRQAREFFRHALDKYSVTGIA